MKFSFSLPLIGENIRSEDRNAGDNEETVRIKEKSRDIISAGVNMLLAPTEGITHERLDEISRDDEFADLCSSITEMTAELAGDKAEVGGLIAPSGIEQYTGGIFESLYFDYLEKITVLKDSGADFILLNNAGTLGEMRAAVFAAETAEIPIFITMDVDEDGKNVTGTDYIASLITLQSLGAAAFGISCSEGTEIQAELLSAAFAHAEIPLVAVGALSCCSKEELTMLSESGAAIFFNNAGSLDSDTVSFVKKLSVRYDASEEKDSYAAAVDREAFFLFDDLVLSEPLTCSYRLADDIIDMDDENINSVYVELYSTDDAAILADNASMTRLPITVHSNDAVTLEAALRYFQGRLIVDTRCDISEEQMQQFSEKYGAILY